CDRAQERADWARAPGGAGVCERPAERREREAARAASQPVEHKRAAADERCEALHIPGGRLAVGRRALARRLAVCGRGFSHWCLPCRLPFWDAPCGTLAACGFAMGEQVSCHSCARDRAPQ